MRFTTGGAKRRLDPGGWMKLLFPIQTHTVDVSRIKTHFMMVIRKVLKIHQRFKGDVIMGGDVIKMLSLDLVDQGSSGVGREIRGWREILRGRWVGRRRIRREAGRSGGKRGGLF